MKPNFVFPEGARTDGRPSKPSPYRHTGETTGPGRSGGSSVTTATNEGAPRRCLPITRLSDINRRAG